MLAALAKRDGDQAPADRYQAKLDALASKVPRPDPKPLQGQAADLHHQISKLDRRMESEVAKPHQPRLPCELVFAATVHATV